MKLAANKSYFSSLKVIKHSCSTPISNIILNLELSLNSKLFSQLKPNYQLYLQQALLSAKYLKEILHSDLQQPKCYQFSINQAVQEVISICRKPDQDCQLISFLKINDQVHLQGNKLYFQECIICLLNNAFESYAASDINKLVILNVAKDKKSDKVKISVTDGGKGFEHFFKDESKDKNKSNKTRGVGLPFIQEVVTTHFKGRVMIQTYPQKGSTVSLIIPLKSDT